jgi:hypothetical protein
MKLATTKSGQTGKLIIVNSVDIQKENLMSKKRAVPRWLNSVMKFVLRTPLHGMVSNKIMLLTFTGCKSGKNYTIPVSYTQKDNSVMMFTNHIWWKNLVNNALVTLHLRGRQRKATVDLNTDDVDQIAPVLAEHLRDKPTDAPIHNVTYDDTGEPVADEVRRAAGNVRMVRFKLA